MTKTPVYTTALGAAFQGDALDLLKELQDESVNLFFTSPPFALQRQKEYGNRNESEYVDWLIEFAAIVKKKLRGDGSFVLDLGGAYQKGVPSRSLYPFRVVTRFCDELGFVLAEDFYWFNPSKLPSPIEWVNKRKLRAKDAVNTIWWLSRTAWPKANVTNVLAPYSERMKKLIADPSAFYTPKKRTWIGNEFLHTFAVRSQHVCNVRFWPRGSREPPDCVDRVLRAQFPFVNPLDRTGQL